MKGKQNCGTTFSILTSPRALQRTVQCKDEQAITMPRPPIVVRKGKYGLVPWWEQEQRIVICYFAQTTITRRCVISLKQKGVQGSIHQCTVLVLTNISLSLSDLFGNLEMCV